MRAPERHVHLHPAPGEPVGALTADLHRRGGGDRQLDVAAEGLESFLQLVPGRRLVPLDDLPLGIAGRGRRREIDLRDVSLVQSDEAWLQLSCPTGQHEQQPRRERIERARVARARARSASQLGDHLERGWTARLVQQRPRPRAQAPAEPRAETYSRRMNSVISSIESSLEKPAACRWPPPPDLCAIAETSTSSVLERSETRRVGPSERGGSRISTETIAPSTARR